MHRFLGNSWVSITIGLHEQTNVQSELILLCRDEMILSMPFRMHVCSVASAVSNSLWLYGLYVAHQAPLSVGFSRQYWSGLPCSPSGDAPDPEIQPASPALQADSLPLSHQGSPCHSPVTIQHEAWTWSYVRIWDEPHSFFFPYFFKIFILYWGIAD